MLEGRGHSLTGTASREATRPPVLTMSQIKNLSLRQMLSVAHLGSPGAKQIRGRPPPFLVVSQDKTYPWYMSEGRGHSLTGTASREAAKPPVFRGIAYLLGLSTVVGHGKKNGPKVN